jgi:secreted trypsin-like serine protease
VRSAGGSYRRRVLKRTLPIITALLVLAIVPAAGAKPPVKATASIVGGHDADIADWPSIAFVLAAWDGDDDGQIESAAGCTGTVIAPNWVISAAHCAFRPDGKPVDGMVTVTGVADNTDEAGEAIAADRLVVDPHWNPQTLTGDALLIHLKSRSSRPAMKVAVPGGQYVTADGVPNAAGWGTIDEDSKIGTNVLKEAYLALQDDDVCASFAGDDYDPATQTCAGTPETAGACHGDSGGPLVVFDKATGTPALWGLTSYGPQLDFGMKPCELHAPAIYSWVPGFAAFIKTAFPTTTPPRPPLPPQRPPVVTPSRDTLPPVVSRARLSRKKLKPGKRATLSFDLSEASAVTVTVLRKAGGAYAALSPSVPLSASAGHVARQFSARLDGRKLKRGSYKLRIDAVDSAGNRGVPAFVAFKVVR